MTLAADPNAPHIKPSQPYADEGPLSTGVTGCTLTPKQFDEARKILADFDAKKRTARVPELTIEHDPINIAAERAHHYALGFKAGVEAAMKLVGGK